MNARMPVMTQVFAIVFLFYVLCAIAVRCFFIFLHPVHIISCPDKQ